MTTWPKSNREAPAPLIVITGPTASGKSGLALELAKKYGGEIICADSRTVYKGMDIGTAKPSAKEQLQIPHHLLDVLEPNQRFTAADFQRLTRTAITDIRQRGKVPFLVGGTGLYIDSIVLEFEFGSDTDQHKRKLLEEKSVEELSSLIKEQRIRMPTNMLNKRHLVRTLEHNGVEERGRSEPIKNIYVVSIATDKNILEERIRVRADEMFSSGVLDEARQLNEKYGWEAEAMTGNIYPILRQVIEGHMTIEQAKERFIIRDRQLAKRQITWIKRHNFVHWLSVDEARHEISQVLDRFKS